MQNQVATILQNKNIIRVVKQILQYGYTNALRLNAHEVHSLLDNLFEYLTNKKFVDGSEFQHACAHIHAHIYGFESETAQFPSAYYRYKSTEKDLPDQEYLVKSTIRYSKLRVLDFGCGRGALSRALCQWYDCVVGMDIGDGPYEEDMPENFHFRKMRNPDDITGEMGEFDLVIARNVLHHISEEYIDSVLGKISALCKRSLQIKEELILRSEEYQNSEEHAYKSKVLMKTYLDLSALEQKAVLSLIDFIGNNIVQKDHLMPLPFAFRTKAQWDGLLAKKKFEFVKGQEYCFESSRAHGGPHYWLEYKRMY